jgi:outer membrane lipoprotein-sorting protein
MQTFSSTLRVWNLGFRIALQVWNFGFRMALFLVLIGFVASEASAQNPTEIVTRADEHMRGTSSSGEMSMTIVRPTWERTISMKMWSRGTQYSLVLVTAPARDQGSSFLKRRNEIWNWVPSIGRSVKLPPSMMMQSWMGSDFTNDDLVRESSVVNDYTHVFEGETQLEDRDVYIVDLFPKPDAPVVWGRVRMYISKQDYLQLKTEFFDDYDELVQTMTGTDIRTFDGRSIPSKLTMIPADKPGHSTIMEYKSLNFNANIPESFFTVQNMRRVE